MDNLNALNRYAPIVDNPEAFLNSCRTALPTTIWRNGLRVSAAEFDLWKCPELDDLSPLAWIDGAYRLNRPLSRSMAMAYLAGLFHTQEEVSLLPVQLLGAKPGERVLDLCAAPGNKTAQLAIAMNGEGTVVANDSNRSRLGVLRSTMDRLGLTNVVVTSQDGTRFPGDELGFDRVLVDVPCTCEGTTRKHLTALKYSTESFRNRLIVRQRGLLTRALELCNPGGRVVYATCTYAPEECEGIVSHVLKNTKVGKSTHIVPCEIAGLHTAPGISSWMGTSYPDDIGGTIRIWPHLNDTGGFYAAVLEKSGPAGSSSIDKVGKRTRLFPEYGERHLSHVLKTEIDRFQIPQEMLESFSVIPFSRKYESVVSARIQPPVEQIVLTAGVAAINVKGDSARLSTAGIMLFARFAQAGGLHLEYEKLVDYLKRQDVVLADNAGHALGSALVHSRGVFFGRGTLDTHQGVIRLRSQYPKIWAGVDVKARLSRTD